MALFSAVFLFALPLLQADDRDDDHRDGGGGVGISIDIGQIINAFSHHDDKKDTPAHAPAPKKADDDDCPERYKALVALLNSLSPVVQALADAIQDRQSAIAAEGDARALLDDANIQLMNAIMEAERHPNDAGAAQAVANAQKAVDAAKAAFQKVQDQVKAAQAGVADCAEAYAAALKQYDAALADYNAHCRDYKPGPPFPPYPNGGNYTPPSVPAPPDVPIPSDVVPGPGTPGGNPSKPGGGSSTSGSTPAGAPATPGNTPSTSGSGGPANSGNGPANSGPSTPGSATVPPTTSVPSTPTKPGPPPESPGGSPGAPAVMVLETDDCPERLKKLLADISAFNHLMPILISLEWQLGIDEEDFSDLVEKMVWAAKDPGAPQTSYEDERELLRLLLDELQLNAQLKQAEDAAQALLREITAEEAAYREHCGEPPPFTGILPLIPLGPGAVYAGAPLGDECAELLKKVRAAQAECYLKTQQFYKALGELTAARQRVVELEQAATDARNAVSTAENNVARAYYNWKDGVGPKDDGSLDKLKDARDKADQAANDLKNSPEYAAALADEKAKEAAFHAVYDASKAASAALHTLIQEYEKHCGKYPYDQVNQDLEQQYGPADPRSSSEENGVPEVKGDLGGPVDENL